MTIDYYQRHRLYHYSDAKESGQNEQEIFSHIYQDHTWNIHTQDSASGEGSNLLQTAALRRWLPSYLHDLHIKSILDIPCGDFFWMKEVDLGGISYLGADIVPQIIAKNNTDFSSPRRSFKLINLLSDELPEVDAIFCRDCLVHFSLADIFKALKNIRKSGAKYLMTTTFPLQPINYDIETGGWRPLNFALPPFSFPDPEIIYNEKCTEMAGAFHDKSIGVWVVDKLNAI